MEAQRIVTGSFGTASFPDPCKSIFSRFFSSFVQSEGIHDNSNVAFAPVGDGLYACTETPNMHRVDLDSLDTLEPVSEPTRLPTTLGLHACLHSLTYMPTYCPVRTYLSSAFYLFAYLLPCFYKSAAAAIYLHHSCLLPCSCTPAYCCAIPCLPTALFLYAYLAPLTSRGNQKLPSFFQVDFSKYVALHTCTAHQLFDENGDVYNIGSRFGPDAAHVFTVTKNPKNLQSDSDRSWEHTTKIGEIRCSDTFYPTYMHSFGMSENYLIMFESPIRIDIKKFIMKRFITTTFRDCMKWHADKDVKIFILNKKTGEQVPLKLKMAPFFTFHHANTFERDGCLVVDYCRIEQAGNFDALLIENMKTGNFQNVGIFNF